MLNNNVHNNKINDIKEKDIKEKDIKEKWYHWWLCTKEVCLNVLEELQSTLVNLWDNKYEDQLKKCNKCNSMKWSWWELIKKTRNKVKERVEKYNNIIFL